jgi:hypothetical protein
VDEDLEPVGRNLQRRLALVILSVPVVVLLVAVLGSRLTGGTDQASTTTTAPRPPFTPMATWTFRQVDGTGDRSSGKLQLGRLTTAEQAATVPSGRTLGTGCTIDRQRDMVIPGVLEVRNDNAEFDQRINTNFYALDEAGYYGSAALFDVEMFLSNGPDCIHVSATGPGQGEWLSLGSTNSVRPGGLIRADFYVVLHNLRSPTRPLGEIGRIRQLGLLLTGVSTDNTRRIIDFEGPSVPAYAQQVVPFAVVVG